MTVEALDRYLPESTGVASAFESVNDWHRDSFDDPELLTSMVQHGNKDLFADYLNAGWGWIANRAKHPFMRRAGEEAWKLLERAGNNTRTVFTPEDPAEVLADLIGMPAVVRPDPHFVEGIATAMPPIDGESIILFIVPTAFFTHAQHHPIEAVAHLASASQQARDLHYMRLRHLTEPRWTSRMMTYAGARSMAAVADVMIEAGDTYTPSSPDYGRLRASLIQAFPRGLASLPREATY